jgi:hypothetical protein
LAELVHGRVLEEQAGVALPLVLAHVHEISLSRRQGLLEEDAQHVEPHQWVRTFVGPRPNWSLRAPIIAREVSMTTFVRVSAAADC